MENMKIQKNKVVNSSNKQETIGKKNLDNLDNKDIENPDTSDNIMSSIVMGAVSLLGIVSTVFYLKRKEKLS